MGDRKPEISSRHHFFPHLYQGAARVAGYRLLAFYP